MKEFITPNTLSNEIKMLRNSLPGALILIDTQDEIRFYQGFISNSAQIIPCHSHAAQIIIELQPTKIHGVIAITKNKNAAEKADNLFSPDAGDASALLLKSTNFRKVLINIAGKQWEALVNTHSNGLTRACEELARQIIEKCKTRNLRLEQLNLHKAINWHALDIADDFDSCTSSNMEPANGTEVNLSDFTLDLIAECTYHLKPQGLTCQSPTSAANLKRLLEVSFEKSDLEHDSIFWRIRAWERKNPKYPVFEHWRTLDSFGIVWDQRYWENDIHQIMKHSNPGDALSLLKLDLDNFKKVNDSLSHTHGDEAIKLASKVMRHTAGGAGEIYRRGGDEFIIIFPGMGEETSNLLAEQLRKDLETAFIEWNTEYRLSAPPTASIGIANLQPGMTALALVNLVNLAQKRAKELGKNRVEREFAA